MIGLGAAGAVVSRRLVIAIGKGVVKANNPTMLMENGGPLKFTEKSLELEKRKATTGKVVPSNQFLEEEKLTIQKKMSSLVVEHSIPKELIVNLDQILLSYVTSGKYTYDTRGAKTVPVKDIDGKRQITATLSQCQWKFYQFK